MLKIIRKTNTGNIDYGWLRTQHHFSFGQFFDKQKTGIGPLRVINDETIKPGEGYDSHKHRDMEIITIVQQGTLTHTDSLNNQFQLPEGSVLHLSTGTGLEHTLRNETTAPVRYIEVWIEPKKRHLKPEARHKYFSPSIQTNTLLKIISDRHGDGYFKIHQDTEVFIMHLDESHYKRFDLRGHSELYLVQLDGEAYVNGKHLYTQDAVHATETVHIQPITPSHFLIVEIA